ncbi:hypothetical protein HDZ31DRAFT_33515 [Schizophyllum fasciatum]
MKLHSNEILSCLQIYSSAAFKARPPGDDVEEAKEAEDAVSPARELSTAYVGFWQTKRFFETLIGFHKGCVDLTGRHPPRYERLVTRLKVLLTEFTSLCKRCTTTTREVNEWNCRLKKDVVHEESVHEFDPPVLWGEFASKWRLGDLYNLGALTQELVVCVKVMAASKPRFQTLFLHDLPPELLDIIFSMLGPNGSACLGATCKLLREHAVAYAYEVNSPYSRLTTKLIPYQTIRYILDAPNSLDFDLMDKLKAMRNGQEKSDMYVRKVAIRQRNALVKRVRHIIKQKHILARTRALQFSEDWTAELWIWPGILGCTYDEFVDPLVKPLAIHLRDSPATSLRYSTRYLQPIVWSGILRCPTLRSLSLLTSLKEDVYLAHMPSRSPARSIINLELVFKQEAAPHFLWEIVSLCPSALFLSVCGPHLRGGTYIPANVFISDRHKPLKHLRRIALHGVDAASASVLARAFEAAGDPPLTHFSFSPAKKTHISRDVAFSLILSLRRAKNLRVLRLSGLQYAKPDLLAWVGEHTPGLHVLVLEHQPSRYRECSGRGVLWPSEPLEYAPHLAAFAQLKHFAVNMRMVFLCFGTQSLLRLENGYDGAEEADEEALNRWFRRMYPVPDGGVRDDEEEEQEDPRCADYLSNTAFHATTRLFAIHGKALRTVSFKGVAPIHKYVAWAIDRTPEGIRLRDTFTKEECTVAASVGPSYMPADWSFSEQEIEEILKV